MNKPKKPPVFRRYIFKGREGKGHWMPWTGRFETEDEAVGWFRLYGTWHERDGLRLGLFYRNKEVRFARRAVKVRVAKSSRLKAQGQKVQKPI